MEQNKLARKARQGTSGTVGLRDQRASAGKERERERTRWHNMPRRKKGAGQSLLIMKNNSFDDGKEGKKGMSRFHKPRLLLKRPRDRERKGDSAVDWQIKEESENFKGNTFCLDGKIVEQSHLFLSREAIFITSLR